MCDMPPHKKIWITDLAFTWRLDYGLGRLRRSGGGGPAQLTAGDPRGRAGQAAAQRRAAGD